MKLFPFALPDWLPILSHPALYSRFYQCDLLSFGFQRSLNHERHQQEINGCHSWDSIFARVPPVGISFPPKVQRQHLSLKRKVGTSIMISHWAKWWSEILDPAESVVIANWSQSPEELNRWVASWDTAWHTCKQTLPKSNRKNPIWDTFRDH